uniref:Brix domain-containing protein n=1 Tax=Parascaris univalens TaxID=6257 RepID=A0A915C587_PARUN
MVNAKENVMKEEGGAVELKKKTTIHRINKKVSKMTKEEKARSIRLQKAAAKRARQDARRKLRERLGDAAPPKQQPRTIENTREYDLTMVEADDEEILHDEANDEMSSYFNREVKPKVLITTSPYAKVKVVKQAKQNEYTDVIVVHEDRKMPNGIVLCHLPEGPTAFFKINSLKFTKDIKRKGETTSHNPEVILNNFNTRLGHTVARMFACLFPHEPMFTGRRVVTFHNQRDYIFFRHHRYEFKREGEKAALLELGPRFTLRLKWLQKGTFDTRFGEYEWVLKRHEMETSRRRFFL